jgi:hypothetical protein
MSSWSREALKLARNIHIYVSLLGFLMFLFFAGTGILLNHDSFGMDVARTSERQVTLPLASAGNRDALVHSLRTAAGIALPLTQYNAQADDIEATFTGPGKRVQALIDRKSGAVRITEEDRGLAGRLADLHKGAAAGGVWRAILDGVSILLGVSSLSGIVMLIGLPKRRRMGLLLAAAGTVTAVVGWLVWVPK